MRKFMVTSPFFEGFMIFGYNADGILTFYENKALLEVIHIEWLCKNFPFTQQLLTSVFTRSIIKEVTDISFDRFWSEYDNKVGSKKQAEKLWNSLTDEEKFAVFEHLPKYRYYLKTHQGLMQAYPSTFLNQRRWENEYKK